MNARVKHVVQISQSSVGLLFACIQISKDWNKLSESGLYLGDWHIHLNRIIKKLQQGSDFETDRQQAKSIRNPVLNLLLRTPSQYFNSTQKDWVLAIRGLVIHQALIANKKPSYQLIDSLTKLLTKKIEYENIADLNLIAIKEYVTNNKQQDYEFLVHTLQKLIIKPLLNLTDLIRPKTVLPIQTRTNVKNSQPLPTALVEDKNNCEMESDQEYENDLINYITYVQQFLGEKQNVGIIERYEYVQTFEIEKIIPEIIEDLKDPNFSNQALATLLTFFLHCRPKRLGFIGLKQSSNLTAWIDLEKGCFCWELNVVTEKIVKEEKSKTVISIPLPDQIIDILRVLLEQQQAASENIGDLFNINLKEFDAECKRYVKNKSLTSHWLRLSRLETSFSRYVLGEVDDEVYAAAIGLDFCLGTTSNFNYVVLRGEKLAKILQRVYQNLGFSEQLISLPDDVGSNIGLAYDRVWDLAESLSNKAYQTISAVAKNTSFQNLIHAHNELVISIGSLTAIFTGHRAAEAYGFSRHTFDLDRKLCIICDKRVTDYQWARVVPIPSIIVIWVDYYLSWLESMKYRLSSINKELAFRVEAALNSTSDQSHPLFFTISNNKIKPFSSSDFSLTVENFNLPTNCGRHFIDYLLRDAELDSAQIMAFEGHANRGQEAFGPTSLMSLIQVAEKIHYVLDQAINTKKISHPPKFKPRQLDCSNLRFPRIQFTNLLKDKYVIKDRRSAQCPFDEKSLESLNALTEHNLTWKKTGGKITLCDLVYSLAMIDGVASVDELLAAVSQILESEIYALDDSFFIDTVTKSLGVRRVWISFSTVLIAAAIAEASDDGYLKLQFKDVTFKSLCESVINSVAAHYSIYAQGMLAAWARGEICSRTIKPETLARHHYNRPEKTDFGLTESKRSEVLLDDYLIRKAINRSCDKNQNLGTNETRLKNLSDEINRLLDFQIDELSILVLAKFTQYLIGLQIATSTISRYYSVVREFLDFFIDEITEFSQLAEINWNDIVKNWINTKRLDAESGPEAAAVNHFLNFAQSNIKIRGDFYNLNAAVMEYADFPSHDEINKTFSYIDNNPELDWATKLKAKVMIGLFAQYAVRPSELRSIRLCDVYQDDPVHFVITSEAVGQVKTANANRVLTLKNDEFSTKVNFLQLCHLRAGLASEAFLFGDNVDGSSLDGSQLIFNMIHEALSKVTGCNVSIMSFRHFNVSRDVATVIENSGIDPLKDRKILSIIAAQSGHGHAKTSLQNYCCNLDRQRHKFWGQHLSHQKLGAPIAELKARMELDFKGNLPFNHPSFLLLMQTLRDQFSKTHVRLKNCQEFILKDDRKFVKFTELNSKHFGACYRYVFYKSACIDSELAVFESSILEREKQIIDEGKSYLKDTLNKDWFDDGVMRFRPIIQSAEFLKMIQKVGIMPLTERDAILIAQSIHTLNSKWEIRNQNLLNLLERNFPIFAAANITVEICINQNLEVHTRKLLRQKPFIQLSEKSLPRDVLCQVSFWDSNLKKSLRARRHQEIMVKLNLIFLTRAIFILGELHG